MTAKTPARKRFQRLVDDISALYTAAREVQVRFAWETGRRIVEEEQNGETRAEYGSKLIQELSVELSKKHGYGFSERNLWRMRRFYELKPILPTSAELDWSHYVELMSIRDENIRQGLERRILREGLKSKEIRREVRRLRLETTPGAFSPARESGGAAEQDESKPQALLHRPTGLKLNTFAISPLKVKLKDHHVLIDCGFFVSWPVSTAVLKTIDTDSGMSYTYAATIDRVIDGDTLLVLIEVGFGIIIRDRLRLRAVDCPELKTAEGLRAKRFVEKLLPAGSVIVLKSHKCQTDPYGRFVADVFYQKDITDSGEVIKNGAYLNQVLLDEGFARRVEY